MNLKKLLNQNKKADKMKAAKNVAVGAGVGTAIGLLAGVLFAPKSGKETREQIAKGAKDAVETVKEKITELKAGKQDAACCAEECCKDETQA